MKKSIKLLTILMFCSIFAIAQKPITMQDFWLKGKFFAKNIYGLKSMNSGEYYTIIQGNNKIVKYSYKTGKATAVLFDLDKTKSPIKYISDYQFSNKENKILICTNKQKLYRRSFTADYYIYDISNNEIKPLSNKKGQRIATFSPDGNKIAFMYKNDLYIHDLRFDSERQITDDGLFNHIINGAPDWVYEEEFGFNRAFEWSPDSKYLAFIKFDESKVKEYKMNIFEGMYPDIKKNAEYPSVYSYKYPKAGQTNSIVSVHVYDTQERTTTNMNIGKEKDIYIPRIRWTKNKNNLAIIRLNRHQNKMDILVANCRTGETSLMYREENKYYIAESNFDNLVFLDGGQKFVLSSEMNGYMHLYLFSMAGKKLKDITPGNFDAIDFYGYDQKRKLFYYSSYEESSIEKYAYSINLRGRKKKLTPTKGWNDINFSSNYNYYINVASSADMPPVTSLYNYKGKLERVLEDNHKLKDILKGYGPIAKKEFVELTAADGETKLNAWIMKPINFDANKKYPLLITQYSGPNSQEVKNSWTFDWLYEMARQGYVVACIDPRGTAAKGELFRKCTYLTLGKLESDDVIYATRELTKKPWIDNKNVAIWGWSYGGFMSSLCLMKGNDVFTTAIAVAPVTCWKYYDSIYTERFMRTPQENPEGYIKSTPINYASDLKGNLLICHGSADDNVHIQNTYELTERLVQNGKLFDMAIYTNRNHSIYGGATRYQLFSRFIDYLNSHMHQK